MKFPLDQCVTCAKTIRTYPVQVTGNWSTLSMNSHLNIMLLFLGSISDGVSQRMLDECLENVMDIAVDSINECHLMTCQKHGQTFDHSNDFNQSKLLFTRVVVSGCLHGGQRQRMKSMLVRRTELRATFKAPWVSSSSWQTHNSLLRGFSLGSQQPYIYMYLEGLIQK